MKKIQSTALVCMIATYSFGQKVSQDRVPQSVQNAMTKAFPQATHVKWEKENELFEAEFTMNNQEVSALFKEDGSWLETETEIEIQELPAAIHEYIQSNLKQRKIKEASKISDAMGKTTYEAEIGGKDYLFDAAGSFLKSE